MKLKSILLLASAIAVTGSSFGQSYVTSGGQKYTLLEEGTGTWCGWCPDGAQRIQETIEPTYTRCIAISYHNGTSDAMTLPGDPFNAAYITGFPGGAVDRVPFTHPNSSGAPVTAVNVNRGYWATDVGVRDALSAKFDVSMTSTFDSVTKVITISVKGKALAAATGNYRINAFIIEDSISSASTGYQQGSYLNTQAGSWFMGYGSPLPATRYAHMGVVRKILGINMYGDVAFTDPTIGDSVVKNYTYTIPTGQNYKHMKVVGVVQKYGSVNTDREIENAARADVRTMWKVLPNNVQSISASMQDIQIFPNPASNYIRIEGTLLSSMATSLSITNVIGQVVATQNFPAGGTMFSERISLNNLTSGVYFMNIENNGNKVTRQFTIAK